MKKHIVFLFGAGISAEAGIPLSEALTETVLKGDKIFRDSKGNYHIGKNPLMNNDGFYESRVIEAVNMIYRYLQESYFRLNISPNYEDIYQLSLTLSGVNYCPSLDPFLNLFEKKVKYLLFPKPNEILRSPISVELLFTEVCNYISCIVWQKINCKIQTNGLDYLKLIIDCYQNPDYSEISIFNLNHDLVLETLFKHNNIYNYIDGFEIEKNGVRYWNPNLFIKKNKLKLYKLHGSINWFKFYNQNNSSEMFKLGIPNTWDYEHTKDIFNNYQKTVDSKPLFLTGKDSKIFAYSNGYFLSLISRFNEVIHNVNIIVSSGYSFGDKGINNLLEDWIKEDKQRKIININNKHPEVIFKNNIKTIEKFIQDTSFDELKQNMIKFS